MGNNRSKVPDLEKLVKGGRKKFVRYEEGAMLYSMGVHTFQQLAKDARAVYHGKCNESGNDHEGIHRYDTIPIRLYLDRLLT